MIAIIKRFLVMLLSTALILNIGVLSAFAESTPIYIVDDNIEQLSTTVKNKGISVFGYFGGKGGYPVTVTVKNADNGEIVHTEQIATGENGYYTLLVPGEADMLGKDYKVTVNCITDRVLYEKTVTFLPGEDEDLLLQKANEAVMEDLMADFVDCYGLDVGISLATLKEIDNPQTVYAELAGKTYQTVKEFRESFNEALDEQKQKNVDVISIHVAPDGSDKNKGTIESPFATVNTALDYADYLMAMGSKDNFEILLHGGEYRVTKEIVINRKSEYKNHIAIRNYNEEQPLLNGSRVIDGWEHYKGNIYRARVPYGLENIKVLYENRKMQTMARYPNRQTSYENLFDEYLQTENYENVNSRQFAYKASDLPQIEDYTNLEVGVFSGGENYMWQMNVIKVDSIDSDRRMVTLQNDATYGISQGSYYYWQGALELLDSPGEFYHDSKEGYVYYYPADGNIDGKIISYPIVSNMFTIGNDDGSLISNIIVERIGICCTDRSKRTDTSTEKANKSGNGILILNADNITVKDCEIYAVGGNGITALKTLNNSKISGNHIYDGGQGGVILTGFEFEKTNNLIDNNHIHNLDLILHGATGISISAGYADNNVVSHNRIHDLKRCGIIVGGHSGSFMAGDNVIEYNDVSACCNGSKDSGLIYTMVTSGVTTIRHNYLHDGYSRGSYRAIYPDEASHNTIVEGNLITRMTGSCTHVIQAKGDDIQIRNNYLVDNPNTGNNITSYMRWESGQHTERMKLENNLFYNSGNTVYYHYFVNKSEQRVETSNKNLFYHTTPGYIRFKHSNVVENGSAPSTTYTLEQYRKSGYETNSEATDPLLISMSFGDVRYSSYSPANALGIKALELDKMGLRAGFKYYDGDKKPVNIFVRPENESANSGFINMYVGQTVKLSNIVRNSGGFVIPADDVTVTYRLASSNDAAVLGNDTIIAAKSGMVRVIAKAETADGSVEIPFDVIVSSDNSENYAAELSSIVVQNENGKVLAKLESGELNVKVSVWPKENINAKMFVALIDDNGKLVASGASERVSLIKGVAAEFTAPITVPKETAGKLCVFIWENTDTVNPLFKKIVVF